MAWFQMPNDGKQGDYSVVSPQDVREKNLVPNSIWKVTIPLGGSVDVCFIDGQGLLLTSNAPSVVANPIPETSIGNVRTLKVVGASIGFTMIYASTIPGNGSLPLQVEVTKSQVETTLKSGIALDQPSMALNAHDTPTTYSAQYNYVIAGMTSAQSIIDKAKSNGRLKHLAISCHGFVENDGATRLDLGMGFDAGNTSLFAQLQGMVGVIWIGGCSAAGSKQGKDDCAARAKAAQCYLVAPVMHMSNPPGTKGKVHLAKGVMDMNERFMPTAFNPQGGPLGWKTFLSLGPRLGFKIV